MPPRKTPEQKHADVAKQKAALMAKLDELKRQERELDAQMRQQTRKRENRQKFIIGATLRDRLKSRIDWDALFETPPSPPPAGLNAREVEDVVLWWVHQGLESSKAKDADRREFGYPPRNAPKEPAPANDDGSGPPAFNRAAGQ